MGLVMAFSVVTMQSRCLGLHNYFSSAKWSEDASAVAVSVQSSLQVLRTGPN